MKQLPNKRDTGKERDRERQKETDKKEGDRQNPARFTKHAAARKPSKPHTQPKKVSE